MFGRWAFRIVAAWAVTWSGVRGADLSVADVCLVQGTTIDVVVSGDISDESTIGVTIILEIVPQAGATGTVEFTPAPTVDIVQLGDPWPSVGTFSAFDTDLVPTPAFNASVDDNGTFLPSAVTFSGSLTSFPIVASADAVGVWDLLLSTSRSDSSWEGLPTTLTSGVVTVHQVPEAPATPSAGEQSSYPKNRYLSFVPGGAGLQTALRVTYVTGGMQWWVGPPTEVCENSGRVTPPPWGCVLPPGGLPRSFMAAPLQCDPYYADWSAEVGAGVVLHVYDSAITGAPGSQIVPDWTYEIQAIKETCVSGTEGDYSVPLVVTTSKWGDVCGPGAGGACSGPPDGTVDVANDVTGVLDKFDNTNGLQKARADIAPQDVDRIVDVANDVLLVLGAVTGGQYPFSAPTACP